MEKGSIGRADAQGVPAVARESLQGGNGEGLEGDGGDGVLPRRRVVEVITYEVYKL